MKCVFLLLCLHDKSAYFEPIVSKSVCSTFTSGPTHARSYLVSFLWFILSGFLLCGFLSHTHTDTHTHSTVYKQKDAFGLHLSIQHWRANALTRCCSFSIPFFIRVSHFFASIVLINLHCTQLPSRVFSGVSFRSITPNLFQFLFFFFEGGRRAGENVYWSRGDADNRNFSKNSKKTFILNHYQDKLIISTTPAHFQAFNIEKCFLNLKSPPSLDVFEFFHHFNAIRRFRFFHVG